MRLIITLLFLLTIQAGSIANTKDGVETGKASYYAKKFHNRKTASGEIYKRGDMICAHRTYPFGTKLLVKNLHNNKTVVVRVVDRGPFKKGRIIDVSFEAAKQLDFVRQGIAKVEVSVYNDTIISHPDSIKNDNINNNIELNINSKS